MIESKLQRPDNTQPCHEMFRVDEKEIFINPNDKLYRYYQMCPHCGYIVNIPEEILIFLLNVMKVCYNITHKWGNI